MQDIDLYELEKIKPFKKIKKSKVQPLVLIIESIEKSLKFENNLKACKILN